MLIILMYETNSDYDVIATIAQHRSDVIKYPYHKAYIWGRTLGEDKVEMKVGAGAFTRISINSTNTTFKFYTKLAAKIYVFNIPLNVLDMEMSSNTLGKTLCYKIYLKLGNNVNKNENKKIELALNLTEGITTHREVEIYFTKNGLYFCMSQQLIRKQYQWQPC